jgi:rhamnulokinase
MFGEIAPAGTQLGEIRKNLSSEIGLTGVRVVLPGSHDTASAVMAVPASHPGEELDWCYISSGTWSLMGVEWPTPIINAKCRQLNFTNEGGVGSTTRLLKNIAGLWLIQECRRIWQLTGQNYTWEELTNLAQAAPQLVSLIDPDAPEFVSPENMPDQIRSFCSRTGQTVPNDKESVLRTALESLALRYRTVLGWLEELTGVTLKTIHIVGGGTQNRLLCQMAADACNRTVIAGPVEATAIGNVALQAVAAGRIASVTDGREIIRRSFAVEQYEPENPDPWDAAFDRFTRLGA